MRKLLVGATALLATAIVLGVTGVFSLLRGELRAAARARHAARGETELAHPRAVTARRGTP